MGNILVNHYSSDAASQGSEARRLWRRSNITTSRVKYCLIDFNISLLLPSNVRRLPNEFAHVGIGFFHPPDVSAGERDYDPYKFDVACLGNLFACNFDVSTFPKDTDLWLTCIRRVWYRKFRCLHHYSIEWSPKMSIFGLQHKKRSISCPKSTFR